MKRKILVTGILVLSLGICFKVSSYSSAKVENAANLIISNSEDALIAIPDTIEIIVSKEITETKTLRDEDSEVSLDGETSDVVKGDISDCKIESESEIRTSLKSSNFSIRNNMKQAITVNVDAYSGFNISDDQGLFNLSNTFNGITILPDMQADIPIHISDSIENSSFEITISAAWPDGSAQIMKEVNVNVETTMKEVVVDLRKPKLPEPVTQDQQEADLPPEEPGDQDQQQEIQEIQPTREEKNTIN